MMRLNEAKIRNESTQQWFVKKKAVLRVESWDVGWQPSSSLTHPIELHFYRAMGRPFFGDSYEQYLILYNEYNNYLLRRAGGTTSSFWVEIFAIFFNLYPARTEEEHEEIKEVSIQFTRGCLKPH